MDYTDEEIVTYAKSYIRHMDQQEGKRLVLGFIGAGGIAMVILLIGMIVEKSEKVDGGFFQDGNFLSGVGFGILISLVLAIAVLGFFRMFTSFHGKDVEVYQNVGTIAGWKEWITRRGSE